MVFGSRDLPVFPQHCKCSGAGQLIDLASGGNAYSDALGSFFSSSFDTTDVSKPHGYLVWMLYDNDMKLIPAGSGAKRVTDPNELKYLLEENIAVVQDGYMHAYVSNGSSKGISFDNFMLTYIRGKTRQINHYYPYGLSIDGLEHSDEYLNKYTSKELQTGEFDPAFSSGLEMFDFHARFYDPQVGKWFTPDPAEQFHNPYLAMANNPVRYTDPTGTYVPMRYWGKGDNGVTGFDGGGGNSQGDEFGDVGSINGWSYYHQSNLPSNNSWLIGARSKEYNRQFLSSNGFAAVYGPQQPKYVDQQNRLKFIGLINSYFKNSPNTSFERQGIYNPYEKSFLEYMDLLRDEVNNSDFQSMEELAGFIEAQPWADVLKNEDTDIKIGKEWANADIYIAIMQGIIQDRITEDISYVEIFGTKYSNSIHYQPERIYYFGKSANFRYDEWPQIGFTRNDFLFIISDFRLDIYFQN